jgi:hypothetical protein
MSSGGPRPECNGVESSYGLHFTLLSRLLLQPLAKAMTGSLVYLGPQPERAAAFKLFGNLTLLGVLGVLGDVGRLAAAVGIDMKDAFSLFEHFNPGQMLPQRAKRIRAGQYNPAGVRDVDGAQGSAVDGGRGCARWADAGDGAGVGEVVG